MTVPIIINVSITHTQPKRFHILLDLPTHSKIFEDGQGSVVDRTRYGILSQPYGNSRGGPTPAL